MVVVKPLFGTSSEMLHEIIHMLLEGMLASLFDFFTPCVNRNATFGVLACCFCAMLNGMGHAYLLEMAGDTGVEISVFSAEVTHREALKGAFSKRDVEQGM